MQTTEAGCKLQRMIILTLLYIFCYLLVKSQEKRLALSYLLTCYFNSQLQLHFAVYIRLFFLVLREFLVRKSGKRTIISEKYHFEHYILIRYDTIQ